MVVRNLKGNRLYSLRLPAAVVRILPELPKGEPGELMFPERDRRTWSRMLKPVKKVVPKLAQQGQGWHTFRRTVGSLLVQDGVSLYKVAKILGHKDTRITEKHYAHLAPEEAAEELERL